jgi:hypothetical protein
MSYLALFMLKEAKKSGLYCGGASHVFRMENTVKRPVVSRIFEEGDLLVGFPDSIVRILSVLTDPKVADGWIEEKVDEFKANVMAVRAELKQTALAGDRMKKMLEELRPSSPDKSEGQQ